MAAFMNRLGKRFPGHLRRRTGLEVNRQRAAV